MAGIAEHQIAECLPPRRGAVWSLTVDSTARNYDLSALAIDGVAPDGAGDRPRTLAVWMQAETNDVFFHFSPDAQTDLSDTTAQAASSAAAAYATTYGAMLKAGNLPTVFRINRTTDRYLVVKAASTSGKLRLWAASQEST